MSITTMMVRLPKELKERFQKCLQKENEHKYFFGRYFPNLNQSSFILYHVKQFCDQIEDEKEKGEIEKVPTEYSRKIKNVEMGQFHIRIHSDLKNRFNESLQYVSQTRSVLFEEWINTFCDEVEKQEKSKA